MDKNKPLCSLSDNDNGKQQQQHIPDHHSDHPMIPVPNALRIVLEETAKIVWKNEKPNTVTLPARSPWSTLLHSVLAANVVMEEPGYPNYDASIMDGYAIWVAPNEVADDGNIRELPDETSAWTHRIVDKVYAGSHEECSKIATAQDVDGKDATLLLPVAVYITTGAMVPQHCNCVVPIEDCQVSNDDKYLRITAATLATLKPQTWIRPMGCDIPSGSMVLPKGHILDPVAIGLIHQSGVETIQVQRRIQVGVLSTGNELIADPNITTANIAKGMIPDVNRPILLSLLSTYGNCCNPIDLGMVRDDSVEDMTKTVRNAIQQCDIIITTGGVSMGEMDIVEHVLVEKCGGSLHFGRMNMKPGKPTTFVTVPANDEGRTALVFAMPGNPVSATVCTQLLVKPCLDLFFDGMDKICPELGGKGTKSDSIKEIVEDCFVHPEVIARLAHDIVLDEKRPEYHRVQVLIQEDGKYQATSTGVQRSSRLMSLRDAEGLLVLPPVQGKRTVALQGEEYPVLLLNNTLGKAPVRVRDSIHLKTKTDSMKIAVVEVLPAHENQESRLEDTCKVIENALSGSKSGNAVVVTKAIFKDVCTENLYSLILKLCEEDVDLVVVSCASFEGDFPYHLSVSNALNQYLSKQAVSLALQARQGAAAQHGQAALFEVVVGYIAGGKSGSMLICLPEIGVHGALSNVRGLLKHGLNLARGKAHNHHHTKNVNK
jgi:molybdenum cofactor synthesis domain-containing protein